MKRFLYLLLLIFITNGVASQVIKIDNGLSFSNLNSDKFPILNKQITKYAVLAGYEYLENKYYYLSSQIGFIQKGGKEIDNVTKDYYSESWSYLHLNTTFRVKTTFNEAHIYAGIGPKLDILIGSNQFKNSWYEGYNINKVSFGLRPEIGFVQPLSNKVQVGLNGSYLVNIGGFGSSDYNKLSNNLFQLMLSLGYRIK